MLIPGYHDPLLALRIDEPLAERGAGGAWRTGFVLECLIGETVTIVADKWIAQPYFAFDRRPPGSSAALTSGSFTPDMPGLYIVLVTFPQINDGGEGVGLVLSPDTTKIARVYIIAFPATQLDHSALKYWLNKTTFITNLYGQTVPQEGTPTRPLGERRNILQCACQNEGWRDKVIANLEASPTVTPNAAFADTGGDLSQFGA